MELSLLSDPSAQLGLYEADGLDILDLSVLPPAELDRARQRHVEEYVSGPSLSTGYVGFDVSRPPFDDVRVRRAFVLAVDRETLVDVMLGGYEAPATGGFVPPGMPGHTAGVGLSYDAGQARQLLTEVGYPQGRDLPAVNLLAPRGREPMCEYLQAQWREVLGVEITWETMAWPAFLDRMDREPPYLFLYGWVADYPDPDNFLRVSPAWRRTRWRDETYARLVEEARRVTDQQKRMKMYQEADRRLVRQAVIMPLGYGRWHLLVKPWVRRFPTSALKSWFWKDVIIEPHQ